MKYSRVVAAGGPSYLASTAVVLSEMTKLIICLAIYINEEQDKRQFSVRKLLNDLFGPGSDYVKMMVPAILYVIQNNLQYLAVSMLDPATFQVTYQMKIITTALFSVWMLNKSLNAMKWASLIMLTVGVALVSLPTSSGGSKERSSFEGFIGLIAVAISCVLSGLAGVWFEKVLKGSKTSLWLRNIQLSFFSVIPGFIVGVLIMDGGKIAEDGFFQNYTIWTFGAIACQAVGGLIVAVVVKYADNILKGFATSISIILSSIASVFLFDFEITLVFTIGAALVLYATHMYGLPAKQGPVLPRDKQDLLLGKDQDER
ncbi:hypothetical protein HDV05_006427 [Chytridiales sp. JEL 0842]|nr:hypothetical protein HDV05_006427 [Chytridiales sp. JEL 0842]